MAASDSQRNPEDKIVLAPVLLPVDFHARLCVMAERRGMDQTEFIGKMIELAAQEMGVA